MDLYGMDKSLSDLGNRDFNDFLENDVFSSPTNSNNMASNGNSYMDQDWFDSFFEDPVLNDKMMSDAIHPPHIQNEHSYSSLAAMDSGPDSPLNLSINKDELAKEMDMDIMICDANEKPNVKTTMMTTTTSLLNTAMSSPIKQESFSMEDTQLYIRQPTIILTTTQQQIVPQMSPKKERTVLPRIDVKIEPVDCFDNMDACQYESVTLPPTPPGSSSSSDSEGSLSPQRSEPSSPIRQLPLMRTHPIRTVAQQQALFTSPIPTSGVLVLTEEERRTLITEGYPLPTKLPLTKQEEKNLKKIRRKIKNKISAQESRRKKKEYLETLEKRMEGYNQENVDLKKKVEHLETNNRSLLSQLQKLQSLVGKVGRSTSAATSTQTGTCLMVMVLCFAVFLGSWSPSSLSIGGYQSLAPTPVKHMINIDTRVPMGPQPQEPQVDTYSTPNKRSRVLLSMKEEADEHEMFGPHLPFSQMLSRFFNTVTRQPKSGAVVHDVEAIATSLPRPSILQSHEKPVKNYTRVEQARMHPDIAANITVGIDNAVNATA